MNNKRRCNICKHYSKERLFFNILSDNLYWCDVKDCFIARPNEHVCGRFQHKWFRKILNRLLSVRGMMGR